MAGRANWDYAELAKLAKDNGGPEFFMKQLKDSSRTLGHHDMYPWIPIAAAVGACLCYTVEKIVNYSKNKKAQAELKTKEAEIELIRGIKEYEEQVENQSTTDANNDKEEIE